MANHAPPDRYRRFDDFADLGSGADEFEGARRFTRPSEAATTRKAPDLYRQAPSEAFTTHQPTTRKERRNR